MAAGLNHHGVHLAVPKLSQPRGIHRHRHTARVVQWWRQLDWQRADGPRFDSPLRLAFLFSSLLPQKAGVTNTTTTESWYDHHDHHRKLV